MPFDNVLYCHSLTSDGNARAITFFDMVAEEILGRGRNLKDELQIIVVVHAYEISLPFIQSLDKVANVAGIVIKNSTGSLRPEYGQCLREAGYKVLDIEKADFVSQDYDRKIEVQTKIYDCLKPNMRTAFMDHGGYGAFLGQQLIDLGFIITEYAANGEHRWAKLNPQCPITSTGASHIKIISDIGSAETIVDGTAWYMLNHNLPVYTPNIRVGVIGHGRLGGGVASTLNRRYPSPISVYDIDPVVTSNVRTAQNIDRNSLLSHSDIIFLAAGKQALSDPANDFALMKDRTLIFTVTSIDDEVNLDQAIDDGILIPIERTPYTHAYRVARTGHRIFFPFGGQSANIIFPNFPNATILQPYALQMAATLKLYEHYKDYAIGVHPVEPRYEALVARLWNEVYNPQRPGPQT